MDFQATLRFAVMSDLHYSAKHLHVRDRFRSAMQTIYNYCEKESYTKLDALYIVGDFTDLGQKEDMQRLAEDCRTSVKPETKTVITLANHELHYVPDYKKSMEDFSDTFHMDFDRHEVIGGYHFISLSATIDKGPWHDSFDEPKRNFLKAELDKARADGGNKPIFVFQHAGIPTTVAGGYFGHLELYPILVNYPQVIDFSGHSHQPVNHPKEIYQGEFTAVSCGSLLDLAVATGYENPNVSCSTELDRTAAHMLVVEVDAEQRVRIRRLDVIAGDFFENDSYIVDPANRAAHRYTQQRAKDAPIPYFAGDAQISAVRADEKIRLEFSAAACVGERIAEYNIAFSDSNGTVLLQKSISSGYQHLVQPTSYTVEIDDIPEICSAAVYAAGFWDNRSAPLRCAVK